MKKSILCISIVLYTLLYIQAQTYNFSVREAPYVNLEKSISLTNDKIWDDPFFEIPIGFDFEFFDLMLNTLYTDNGQFLFDKSTISDVQPFSAILGLTVNLIDRGVGSGKSASNISYMLDNINGENVFIIEWSNAGFYLEWDELETVNDFINFQIWLYEESGQIDFRFGPNAIAVPSLYFDYGYNLPPSIGLLHNFSDDNGSTVFDEFLLLEGNSSQPNLLVANSYYENEGLSSFPNDSTIYTFSRRPVSVTDANSETSNFMVFPNPITDQIQIHSKNGTSADIVTVFDAQGRKMLRMTIDSEVLNVHQLPVGIYILQIETDDSVETHKLVKLDY